MRTELLQRIMLWVCMKIPGWIRTQHVMLLGLRIDWKLPWKDTDSLIWFGGESASRYCTVTWKKKRCYEPILAELPLRKNTVISLFRSRRSCIAARMDSLLY